MEIMPAPFASIKLVKWSDIGPLNIFSREGGDEGDSAQVWAAGNRLTEKVREPTHH